MRILIGGIGYRNLRDHSVGGAVVDWLSARPWPADVTVEDVSYNPIALVQRLEDEPTDRRFDRSIFISSVARPGRRPGTVTPYRWDRALPDPDAIQAAIAEGITGVISLDNTLVIGRYFGVLPNDVLVVEVEPEVHEFGDTFSPVVAKAFERVCRLVALLATDPAAAIRMPEAPLGGGVLSGAG